MPDVQKKNIKNIALVDIDGCMDLNGQLNEELLDRLRAGNAKGPYNEIIFVTQRSKFMREWEVNKAGYDPNFSRTDAIIKAVNQRTGLRCRLSTSVDPYLEKPLAYLSELTRTDKAYQTQATAARGDEEIYNNDKKVIGLRREVLEELQTVAKKLSDEEIDLRAQIAVGRPLSEAERQQLKSYDLKNLTKEQVQALAVSPDLKKYLETTIDLRGLKKAIKDTKVNDISEENISGKIKAWSYIYPNQKVTQLDQVVKAVQQEAGAAKIHMDFFDDSQRNLEEIKQFGKIPSQVKLRSYVVKGEKLMPLERMNGLGQPSLELINNTSLSDDIRKELFMDYFGIKFPLKSLPDKVKSYLARWQDKVKLYKNLVENYNQSNTISEKAHQLQANAILNNLVDDVKFLIRYDCIDLFLSLGRDVYFNFLKPVQTKIFEKLSKDEQQKIIDYVVKKNNVELLDNLPLELQLRVLTASPTEKLIARINDQYLYSVLSDWLLKSSDSVERQASEFLTRFCSEGIANSERQKKFQSIKEAVLDNEAFKNKFTLKGEAFKHFYQGKPIDVLLAIARGESSSEALEKEFLHALPELCYQQKLKAKALVNTDVRFDPQGHALTEVALTQEDYKEVLSNIYRERGDNFPNTVSIQLKDNETVQTYLSRLDKDALRKTLSELIGGQALSVKTLVNLDAKENTALLDNFKQWVNVEIGKEPASLAFPDWFKVHILRQDRTEVEKKIREKYQKNFNTAVDHYCASQETSSVNALQEEMEMYASLAMNVYKNAFDAVYKQGEPGHITEETWQAIRLAAFTEINGKVKTVFQQALVASSKNGQIDFFKLNQTLAKARGHLADASYQALVDQADQRIAYFRERCLTPQIASQITKKSFEKTPASTWDYFCSNALGLMARIAGSENTAHHKEAGEGHQANRLITYSDGSMVMRLPSIPDPKSKAYIKENKTRDQWAVDDTALKLQEVEQALRKKLADYEGPVTLNRETSLAKDNKQEWRIGIEIQAIHQVNTKKNSGDKSQTNFVFIQGIPVNQHGKPLSHSGTAIVRETTLMAEMAMLANFHQAFAGNDTIKSAYEAVIEQYQAFLNDKNRKTCFCDTAQGQAAKNLLAQLKQDLKQTPLTLPPRIEPDLRELVNQTLTQIFANNQHLDLRFGTTIQALSCFAQKATIAGCKSANERFFAVESRAILLRLLNQHPCTLMDARCEVLAALKNFSANPSADSMENLVAVMDANCNKYATQIRAAAAVSGLDQGAAAKLMAFVKGAIGVFYNWDTNRAVNTTQDRLQADGASEMQAHFKNKMGFIFGGNTQADRLEAKVKGLEKNEVSKRQLAEGAPLKKLCDDIENTLLPKAGLFNFKAKKQLQAIVALIQDPFSAMSSDDLLAKIDVAVGKKGAMQEAWAQVREQYLASTVELKFEDGLQALRGVLKGDQVAQGQSEALDVPNKQSRESSVDSGATTEEENTPDPSRESSVTGDEVEKTFKNEEAEEEPLLTGFAEASKAQETNPLFAALSQQFISDHLSTAQAGDQKAIDRVLNRVDQIVKALTAEEQTALTEKLPPAKSVSKGEASIGNEDNLIAKVTEAATRLAIKAGPLAVAIATFVLTKGAG